MQALAMNEALLGPEHLTTAQVCHAIAVLLSMAEDYREAIKFEKRHCAVLTKLFGEQDSRTAESNIWLKQFTAKAVQAQMDAKKNVERVGRALNLSEDKVTA
jgi:hypothetical protein